MMDKVIHDPSWLEAPDELSLVDDDIREIFENRGNYFIGTPLVAQLIKEIRLLRMQLETKDG